MLASFSGSGDPGPGGLTLGGSNLYGTTPGGGTSGNGTVFSIPVTGGAPRVLASFNASNGSPESGLTLVGNTLYGTAADGNGSLFALTLNSASAISFWASAANGNWSDSRNWTGGVPNSVGAARPSTSRRPR